MYFTHSADTVFKLMGFQGKEYDQEIFEHYLELSKKAIEIDITKSNKPLDELCHEIYSELTCFSSKY